MGEPVTDGQPRDRNVNGLQAACIWRSTRQRGHAVFLLEFKRDNFNKGRNIYGMDVTGIGDDAWVGGLDGGPFLSVRQGSRVLDFEIDIPDLTVEAAKRRLTALAITTVPNLD